MAQAYTRSNTGWHKTPKNVATDMALQNAQYGKGRHNAVLDRTEQHREAQFVGIRHESP